jgi:hypothetical protein
MCAITATTAFAAEEKSGQDVTDTWDEITLLLEDEPFGLFIDSLDKELYGGVYYENDTPHLMATSISNADAIRALLKAKDSSLPNIVIDVPSAKKNSPIYSMNDLYAAKENVLEHLHELNQVVGVGIRSRENSISVYIDNLNGLEESTKESIIDYSQIENVLFYDAEILPLTQTELPVEAEQNMAEPDNDSHITPRYTVRGGTKIVSYSTGNWATLTTSAAYKYGKTGQKLGFITCGHGWNVGETICYNSRYGNVLGTILLRKESGDVDYAFIESDQNSDGYLTDGSCLTNKIPAAEGMSVSAYGAWTSEHLDTISTGKIIDPSISGKWNGIEFDDLFLTTVPTHAGDSGAPIVYNNKYIVGIMKGAKTSATNEHDQYIYGVGVKIYNVVAHDVQPTR